MEQTADPRRIRKMLFSSLPLLFLYMGSTSAKKQGDFGTFYACLTKNNSLRLDCFYADCECSPSYTCEFLTSNGSLLAEASTKESNKACRHTLPNDKTLYDKETFNCTLTRKSRKEMKQLTVYLNTKKVKSCPAVAGLRLHEAPSFLWPAVFVSLWRVVITDTTSNVRD